MSDPEPSRASYRSQGNTVPPLEVIEGGCLCGAVRYRVVGAPEFALACHCRYCQRRLGTAFATIGYFPNEAVRELRGTLATHGHRSDESGCVVTMGFCPTCGTTVTTKLEHRAHLTGIALGTLDEPDLVPIRHHIWLRSKRPWMHEPADVERLERGLGGPRMPTQG
jgi:hypothetical protein